MKTIRETAREGGISISKYRKMLGDYCDKLHYNYVPNRVLWGTGYGKNYPSVKIIKAELKKR